MFSSRLVGVRVRQGRGLFGDEEGRGAVCFGCGRGAVCLGTTRSIAVCCGESIAAMKEKNKKYWNSEISIYIYIYIYI